MILTNNVKLREHPDTVWVDGDQSQVLLKARDLIHQGHHLLTSPLAASGRMHFSPVRSIVLTDETTANDPASVLAIENGITQHQTTISLHSVDHRNLAGYEIIDYELLVQALNEINELEARYEKTGGNQFETGKTQR
ncbi:MAG: GrdX family protein [Clostridiaceae bacterium]